MKQYRKAKILQYSRLKWIQNKTTKTKQCPSQRSRGPQEISSPGTLVAILGGGSLMPPL